KRDWHVGNRGELYSVCYSTIYGSSPVNVYNPVQSSVQRVPLLAPILHNNSCLDRIYVKRNKNNSIKTENVLTAQNVSSVLEVNSEYNNFKLIHFNIRSAIKNFAETEICLNQFKNNFDCIILTETWLIPNVSLIQLKGYTMIYNEASYNQNDGTIIYIRNDIDHIDYTIEKISNTSLINLRFCLNGRSYNLYAMYRPPSTNIIEYIDALQIYLQNQNLKYDYSLFVGDINIDISKSTLHSDDYLNIMSEFGFKSIINDYTRIQENSKSCLDHIFIQSKYDIEDVILPLIMHTNITDHFPVLCQLVLEGKKSLQSKKKEIKHIQYDKLKEQLSQVDWSDVYKSRDVESATKKFINIIDSKINICTKVQKIKHTLQKRKCWVTNGIIRSIETRDKMFNQLQLQPLNETLKQRYKEYRNKLTMLIKKTKINYYKSQINKNITCTKNLWSTVKEMCNSNITQTSVSKIYGVQNEIITDKLEIADTFNNIFANMGENMAKKLNRIKITKKQKTTNIKSMFLAPTTPNEVKQCISRLKPNKSPGIDDIKSTTIKHMADEISQVYISTATYVGMSKDNKFKNLMILYKSLVESHITYGIIGWGGVLNTHLQRLEVIQKRILKIILNKPYTYPSDELFQETNVCDIRQLYFYCISLKMFSEKKDKAKHDYQTRNRNIGNLPVVLMRTSTGQRSSNYLGPKIYNSIPVEIRSPTLLPVCNGGGPTKFTDMNEAGPYETASLA
ncbi:hypothetical protein NQ317_014109, partial [Molorchus minor]